MDNDITLDGGVVQDPDGTYSVVVRFGHVPNAREAEQLSAWLQNLISAHLGEISYPDIGEPAEAGRKQKTHQRPS